MGGRDGLHSLEKDTLLLYFLSAIQTRLLGRPAHGLVIIRNSLSWLRPITSVKVKQSHYRSGQGLRVPEV